MNKLRKQLNQILKEVHPRVYFMKAPEKEIFPYLIYDLPQSSYMDNLETFNLDVDIWDNNENTTELEQLAQDIWNKLNRLYCIDENMQFTVYRQSRLTIEDDDPRIKRRTLIFNIKYYDRSVE